MYSKSRSRRQYIACWRWRARISTTWGASSEIMMYQCRQEWREGEGRELKRLVCYVLRHGVRQHCVLGSPEERKKRAQVVSGGHPFVFCLLTCTWDAKQVWCSATVMTKTRRDRLSGRRALIDASHAFATCLHPHASCKTLPHPALQLCVQEAYMELSIHLPR